MDKNTAVAKLNGLEKRSHDNEQAHGMADQILLDVLRANGFAEVADAYDAAAERITFWYA